MNARSIVGRGLLVLAGVIIGAAGAYFCLKAGFDPAELVEPLAGRPNGDGEHDRGEAKHESHEQSAKGSGGRRANRVELSEEAIKEAGIQIAEAAGGEIERMLSLPGEITLNAEGVARVVPRLSGAVRRIEKVLGDEVQEGDAIAILESRELAEAKAAYVVARQRRALEEANLASAEELHTKKVMPDLEYYAARQKRAEAEIEVRSAENKLRALGLSAEDIQSVAQSDANYTRYEVRAPRAGTIIARHVMLGQMLTQETEVCEIADLSILWAQITLYAPDLTEVRVGQSARLTNAHSTDGSEGTITFISPTLDTATRTALARVVVPNPDRRWKPGQFVTALVAVGKRSVTVLVPSEAVQLLENHAHVFVPEKEDFVAHPVELGQANATHIEIIAGLKPGDRYVAKGAFMLKAELGKGAEEEGEE